MAELLLEILSEEIPAGMQVTAVKNLEKLIITGLNAHKIRFSNPITFYTPRRLTVKLDGIPESTPDFVEERRGPRTDAPKEAVDGFLRSLGKSHKELEKRTIKKGEFYFLLLEEKGLKTSDVLVGLIEDAINNVPWQKSMRWSSYRERWIRPIHSILCLFDGKVVPIKYGGVLAGRTTTGHRFLTDAKIEIKSFFDYQKALEIGYVLVDPDKRKEKILKEAETLAASHDLNLVKDNALLEEVNGLVEWPIVLMGKMDEAFMAIPQPILTTAMRKNQKYFALKTHTGNLAPEFIIVANRETPDRGKTIIAGNERVLRSRMVDAKFFWERDRELPLENCLSKQEKIVFHAKLGTVAEKTHRIRAISAEWVEMIGAEAEHVSRAALLLKADLATELVSEFPELQGAIGEFCATYQGEAHEVALAISDHYKPLGPSDYCPTAPTSVILALADKIDTLVGFWAINEKPSGSKDPFALRRLTLGVIRLIIENSHRINLGDLFTTVWDIAGYQGPKEETLNDLLTFFSDRFRVYLKDTGVSHDLVSAVFSNSSVGNLVNVVNLIDSVDQFLSTSKGASLVFAYKRAANILKIEEKSSQQVFDHQNGIDVKLLKDGVESELFEALTRIAPEVKRSVQNEEFSDALIMLASTREMIDLYFENVTINTKDTLVRFNRLRLLSFFRSLCDQLVDFSKLEGGEN